MKEKQAPKPPSIVLLLGRNRRRKRARRSRLSRSVMRRLLGRTKRTVWVSEMRGA